MQSQKPDRKPDSPQSKFTLIMILSLSLFGACGNLGWLAAGFLDTGNGTLGTTGTTVPYVTTLAGAYMMMGATDGQGSAATFNLPWGLAWEQSTGNLYVADSGNHKIRMVNSAGFVTTFAGTGTGGAGFYTSAASSIFNNPQGVAVDSAGNVYVADTGNNTIVKYAAGVGSIMGGAVMFNWPVGLAVLGIDNVLVADYSNHLIRQVTVATASTMAGNGTPGWTDGPLINASFNSPCAVAINPLNNQVAVADYFNYRIRRVDPAMGQVSTLAGNSFSVSTDGQGTSASFSWPVAVAYDASGNLFVADGNLIRKIDTSGNVTTYAGGGMNSGDGPAREISLASPQGLAVDSAGNLYVAETYANRIRKITP